MKRRGGAWRGLAVLGASVSLVTTLTACTTGTDPQPQATRSASPSPTSSSAGPVTLRVAVFGGPQDIAAYRAMVNAFVQDHPQVTIDLETSPDRASAEGKLERQFVGGTAPDVFLAGSDLMPVLAGERRVQPVDELMGERGVEFGDNYERLGLEAFAADASLQCMPSDVSPYVVFYNQRLLIPSALVAPEQETPTPATGWRWEQFAAAAQAMSHDGVKGVYLEPALTTLTPFLRASGADVVDDAKEPTTLTLADGGSRQTLETVLELARNPQVNLTPAELRREDAVTRFARGRLGMMIGTRALVPRLRQAPGLRFDVFPLPSLGSYRTIADVTGYCISSGSEHVEAAADLVAFATSDEGAELTAASGSIVPANRNAARSAAFVQPSRYPFNDEVFTDAIRRATTMPDPSGWKDVVAQTQPDLNRLFYAPIIDLDVLLPRIDELSAGLLAGPTPSATPEEEPED